MTNREKYLDEILAAMPWGKFSGEIDCCQNRECDDCDFETRQRSCRKETMDWLRAEAGEEPEVVDWSKVPMDTPVWVRDRESDPWRPRYFAGVIGGSVHTWNGGTTSWSSDGGTTGWTQAKLAEEDKR